MADSDPNNLKEYEAKFRENASVRGYGMEVTQHFPCPFCANPDWLVMPIIEFPPESERDITCEACGRTARMLSSRTGEGMKMELVQTGGEDPPAWLEPAPRRLET